MPRNCPVCQLELDDDDQTCHHCGSSLVRTCAVCGRTASFEEEWYQSTKTEKIVCGTCFHQFFSESSNTTICCNQLSEGVRHGGWTKRRVVKISVCVGVILFIGFGITHSPYVINTFYELIGYPTVDIIGGKDIVAIDEVSVKTQAGSIFDDSSWKTIKYGFYQDDVSFDTYDQGRIVISGIIKDVADAAVNVTVTVFFEDKEERIIHTDQHSSFAYLEPIPFSFTYYFDKHSTDTVNDARLFVEAYTLWH